MPGFALRESGDGEEAVAELRRAVLAARRAGDADVEAHTHATLGATLVTRGLLHLQWARSPPPRRRSGLRAAYTRRMVDAELLR